MWGRVWRHAVQPRLSQGRIFARRRVKTVGSRRSDDKVASRGEVRASQKIQLDYSKSEEKETRQNQLEFNVKLPQERSDTVL